MSRSNSETSGISIDGTILFKMIKIRSQGTKSFLPAAITLSDIEHKKLLAIFATFLQVYYVHLHITFY
jgi:hypothetical protein